AWAMQPDPVGDARIAKFHVSKARGITEDDIGRASIGIAVRVRAGRANDQIAEAVAVEIACGGNRVSRLISDGGAIDAKAVAGREVGEVGIRQAAGLAEHHEGGPALLASEAERRWRADDDVAKPVTVDVACSRNREPGLGFERAVDN